MLWLCNKQQCACEQLEEIEKRYKKNVFYKQYLTRHCENHCDFCKPVSLSVEALPIYFFFGGIIFANLFVPTGISKFCIPVLLFISFMKMLPVYFLD